MNDSFLGSLIVSVIALIIWMYVNHKDIEKIKKDMKFKDRVNGR